MFLNAPTTPQAADLADRIHEQIREGRNLSSRKRYELRALLIHYVTRLETLCRPAVEEPRTPATVTEVLRQVTKFWKEHLPHQDYLTVDTHPRMFRKTDLFTLASPTESYDLKYQVGAPGFSYPVVYFIKAAGEMLAEAEQKNIPAEEYDQWCDRFTTWYCTFGTNPTSFIWQNEWEVAALRQFRAAKWDDVRHIILEILYTTEHSAELLSTLGQKFAVPLARFLTPTQLSGLLQDATPTTVRQLFALRTPGRQALTPELLAGMVQAGYTTAAEVKEYARVFGIPFTDMDFYTRVIKAKRLYPVLADYVPVV